MYSTNVRRRREFDASIVAAALTEIRFEKLLAARDPKYPGLKSGVRTVSAEISRSVPNRTCSSGRP
jgi:hypothetical protein